MTQATSQTRRALRPAVLILALGMLGSGCNTVGPSSLATGRSAYNQVLAQTTSEQVLSYIVRMRYSDSTSLLTVASITANLKLRGTVGAEFGVGNASNFAGNLVPLSAGVAFEDNPTISYVPIEGEQFVRRWLAPISLDLVVLVLRSAHTDYKLLGLLIQEMNGLRNHRFAKPEEIASFLEATTLLGELLRSGTASIAARKDKEDELGFELVITNYLPDELEQVDSLLSLLRIPPPVLDGQPLRIPVEIAIRTGPMNAIAIQTRSVADIVSLATGQIEVPQEHLDEGLLVPPQVHAASPLQSLRIRSSKERPENTTYAIQHRGWWFYIDDHDPMSRQTFRVVQTLFLMRIFDSTINSQAAPILTVPVG